MLSPRQENNGRVSPCPEPVTADDSGEVSAEEVDLETMESDAEFDNEEPDCPQLAICDQDSQLPFDDFVRSQVEKAKEFAAWSQVVAATDEDMKDSKPMLAIDDAEAPLAASPPGTPKGIEPDDKCVVIDDSDTPQKGSASEWTDAELVSRIHEIKMALADAKKQRMALTRSLHT